jgi:Uma2 family endonuclease
MVSARQEPFYTEEEYLDLEEKATTRSEYYRGKIYALAGGSLNHNRIVGNMVIALGNHLRGSSCEILTSDMRVRVEAHQLYTYPDAAVVCGKARFAPRRSDTITNPTLIIEVLSPSTQDYDRGQKFEFYRSLPSLRDYLLIHQDSAHVEYFHKEAENRWVLTELKGVDASLTLRSIELTLPLAQIYERVEWTQSPDE